MKALSIATAIVFVISTAFPVAAGLSHDTAAFPRWWGTLDVTIAFVLAVLVFAVIGVARDSVTRVVEDATYRAYRVLVHGIFAMCVLFFLAGDHIVWPNCLTGLAWRTWLVLYCLPWWLAAFSRRTATTNSQ